MNCNPKVIAFAAVGVVAVGCFMLGGQILDRMTKIEGGKSR